ncbi:uracil-DNA glycosylase [Peribacillus psychrosaccharolyticus]|uniref:Uracil-DNA glycosylase n=2 Tax=Peribacillus psychrosaccharolyticus TaxID=1407 RepID=A0A974NRJ8_PERPY|nr:uracil-DNA glycosylase [Peribacillus psychrosaccharolyticus]MEC2055320.1 uracil-DNA glycosylase [Peribacillus psychrosaccharolyticus]MED3745310.1 uracil-DNA glycosylase [Peribacillus psychrosaccharolyticus]QQT02702.1 uracil-DNA glycosylase [Peribacillus psychrosaccharolyticus]
MMNTIKNDWGQMLAGEFSKPYYQHLCEFLKTEYDQHLIHPDKQDIFNAFHFTPFEQVKVVILGQDPYHGPNQAQGLSFSVNPEVRIPPSLRNIFKELQNDIGCSIPNHGSLIEWAKQGVLLLNTVLTVREGEAHSHRGRGWETFTNQVITLLNEKETPIVFILWGKPAQSKLPLINKSKHRVITSAHPSPLAARRGFFGSKPFSKTNYLLKELGLREIDWEIK